MRLAMIRILDDLGYPHFSKRPTNDDVFLKNFLVVSNKSAETAMEMGWDDRRMARMAQPR